MARTKQTARRSSLSAAAVNHLKKALSTVAAKQVARRPKPNARHTQAKRQPKRRDSSSTLVSSNSDEDSDLQIAKDVVAKLAPDAITSDVDVHLLSRELTAAALWSRYYQHGALEDLEEAIRIDRESLGLSAGRAQTGATYAETQANLGVSLLDLFAKTRREDTLLEAVTLLERAVAVMSAPDAPNAPVDGERNASLPRAMVNLGNAYRTRSELTGNLQDLDRAIDMHEDALVCTPGDHPEWDTEIRQNCLARSLMARGGQRDIERAMDLMSARRRVLAEGPATTSESVRDIYSYGYDADVCLPVPDLSNLIKRLTSFPSGCGGFADIFMGEWNKTRRLKQKVAVKVLRPHALNAKDTTVSERVNKMLRAEIRIWHGLEHPNIVKLLGTCRGFGPYSSMILPWFSNGSLPSFLQKHKYLIYSERLRLIREIASGLAYLHSNAIIHGDLTGANVLINDDHQACLSDFGLSVLARDFDVPSMSRFTSGIGGSVRWTAPELYSFGDEIQPRLTLHSDVYAFGSVALEVFTGEVPYQEVQNEMEVLLKYVVPGVPPARPTGGKAVEDSHWDAVQRCWSRDPQSRPLSKTLSSMFQSGDT